MPPRYCPAPALTIRRTAPPIMLALLLSTLLLASARLEAGVMLAGGHLPVCSSMSPDQCQNNPSFGPDALDAHRYRLDQPGILRWALAIEGRAGSPDLVPWLALLKSLAKPQPLTRGELIERIRSAEVSWTRPGESGPESRRGDSLYRELDDASWWMLLDHLQLPPGERREQVQLDASRHPASIEILRRFVALAARNSERERPLIAVSTASSRDPYDALDFYLQAFEQAGAEVVWLPLDAAVRRARSEHNCTGLAHYQAIELGSHDRARVWPEHFRRQQAFCLDADAGLEIAARADGIFLNGGDQWLTLHAFRDRNGSPTPELSMLLRRLERGDLALGGTSAGAAVQSGPNMISNGSNSAALLHGAVAAAPPAAGCRPGKTCPEGLRADSLTFHPPGGLGSVPFAIVDTHFSERQRQFRLLQLLVDSGQRFGLGVDETTALIITRTDQAGLLEFEVIGAEAAWLIDIGSARLTGRQPLTIDDVALLRLRAGSRMQFDSEDGLDSASGPKSSGPATECSALASGQSFNQLLPAAGAEFPALCHTLALDGSRTATSRLWPGYHSPDQPWLLRWQLNVQPSP
jgi:cyanophycinase